MGLIEAIEGDKLLRAMVVAVVRMKQMKLQGRFVAEFNLFRGQVTAVDVGAAPKMVKLSEEAPEGAPFW